MKLKKEPTKRTEQQNRALHKYFDLLADTLNDAGLDMKMTFKPKIDIPWTDHNVKEFLWRPIQIAVLNKKSTKDLEKTEIDKVFEVINRHLSEKFGISLDFPNSELNFLDEPRRIKTKQA
jgi:hypothetical protein